MSVPEIFHGLVYQLNLEVDPGSNNYALSPARLGEGGEAQVFQASLADGRIVAVKQRRPEEHDGGLESTTTPRSLGGFVNEKNVLKRLEESAPKHLLKSLGYFDDLILLQLFKGKNVGDYIQNEPLTSESFLRLVHFFRQLTKALHELPASPHGDITWSNAMYDEENLVVLIDYSQVGITRSFKGTPLFMAREKIEGKKIDQKVDVFAMGVMLYWFLKRQHPYITDTHAATKNLFLELLRGDYRGGLDLRKFTDIFGSSDIHLFERLNTILKKATATDIEDEESEQFVEATSPTNLEKRYLTVELFVQELEDFFNLVKLGNMDLITSGQVQEEAVV